MAHHHTQGTASPIAWEEAHHEGGALASCTRYDANPNDATAFKSWKDHSNPKHMAIKPVWAGRWCLMTPTICHIHCMEGGP